MSYTDYCLHVTCIVYRTHSGITYIDGKCNNVLHVYGLYYYAVIVHQWENIEIIYIQEMLFFLSPRDASLSNKINYFYVWTHSEYYENNIF